MTSDGVKSQRLSMQDWVRDPGLSLHLQQNSFQAAILNYSFPKIKRILRWTFCPCGPYPRASIAFCNFSELHWHPLQHMTYASDTN